MATITATIGGTITTKKLAVNGSISAKSHDIDGNVATGKPPVYGGELVITPKADEIQVLECANKIMPDNVTVLKVPYYETRNATGTTVYIAAEVQ